MSALLQGLRRMLITSWAVAAAPHTGSVCAYRLPGGRSSDFTLSWAGPAAAGWESGDGNWVYEGIPFLFFCASSTIGPLVQQCTRGTCSWQWAACSETPVHSSVLFLCCGFRRIQDLNFKLSILFFRGTGGRGVAGWCCSPWKNS